MEQIRFSADLARPYDRHGSNSRWVPTAHVPGHLAAGALHVPAGGRIEEPGAPRRQILLVTAGAGWVQSGQGEPAALTVGDGVTMMVDEPYSVGSDEGMTIVLMEHSGGVAIRRFEASRHRWTVWLINGGHREEQAAEQVERLLRQYDLRRWIQTTQIRISSHEIPHSHPALTMNTRHLEEDDLALATFLHEQIHWYEGAPKGRGTSSPITCT